MGGSRASRAATSARRGRGARWLPGTVRITAQHTRGVASASDTRRYGGVRSGRGAAPRCSRAGAHLHVAVDRPNENVGRRSVFVGPSTGKTRVSSMSTSIDDSRRGVVVLVTRWQRLVQAARSPGALQWLPVPTTKTRV